MRHDLVYRQESLFFNISEAVCEHVADALNQEQAGVKDVARFMGRSKRWAKKLLNNPERLPLLDIVMTLEKIGCCELILMTCAK